ncbi:MAG: CYTH domain-containing protein [Oscillospiraceae bacterium]|nr:CYTH domain-containing protein [Oscillospiraceae bacterium]
MGTELEWKYAVPDPSLLDRVLAWEEVRSRMVEEPRRYHMRTDYYDAPDRRFSRHKITIRRRMENERSVVCVKAPLPEGSDPHLRGEWELEAEDLRSALPRLVNLGAPGAILEPVCLQRLCGADFLRRAVLLRFADGSAAELALDCGSLFGPTESAPLCELELELKEGAPGAALAFAEALAERFSLRLEPLGKFTRASALE